MAHISNTFITNGMIVDGSGGEPFPGDVLIVNDKITAVGHVSDIPEWEDVLHINAAGCYVTPGFVDIHRHCDYAALSEGFGEIELAQGITTAVCGACGLSAYPFSPDMADIYAPVLGEMPANIPPFLSGYTKALANLKLPVNIGIMAGSCAIRAAVKGFAKTPFTREEISAARYLIEEAMEQGAFGVSLGIMYEPEFYSGPNEIAKIAEAAARYGGVIAAHIRGEGDYLTDSVAEAVEIAQKAGMPLHISHFKCCGAQNWGRGIYKAIEMIDRARKNHDVTVDFYPYHGGASTLLSLIPPGFPRAKWNDTPALIEALSRHYSNWDNYVLSLGFERIILNAMRQPEYRQYNGKSIAEISEETKKSPYTLLGEVLVREEGRAGAIIMSMSMDDVDAVMQLPYANVISDALYPADTQTAHPRLFSAFPKIIRDYVRERRVLTLQEAIRKMTSLPALRMSLSNRGWIKPGYAADINIFKPENIRDAADFSHSGILAEGMDYVFVNGALAWGNGRRIENKGRFVRR